jgi:hypothetical protein
MPRYFFHIKNEVETIRDEDGIELDGLEEVRKLATESARAMLSEAVCEGHDLNGRAFVVMDEQGRVVLNLPFKQAIGD